MKEVFVDTAFWVAMLSRHDGLHDAANAWAQRCCPTGHNRLSPERNADVFAGLGPELRKAVANLVAKLENDPNVTIVHDHEYLKDARRLYAERLDKGYSMVDCISMVVMTARGVSLAPTADKHFVQEGFVALL